MFLLDLQLLFSSSYGVGSSGPGGARWGMDAMVVDFMGEKEEGVH